MDTEKKDTLLLNVVQCDIPPLPVEERLSRCREFLASGPQADLWIFPETFATGFSFPPPPETPRLGRTIREWLHETAGHYHTAICGSALVEDNGEYFNRFFLVDASGREQTYDKRHLFSYGHENRHIAPGHSRELWELHGWKIMPSVCYDLRFPVWSRNDRYYDLLLCVANWPESRNRGLGYAAARPRHREHGLRGGCQTAWDGIRWIRSTRGIPSSSRRWANRLPGKGLRPKNASSRPPSPCRASARCGTSTVFWKTGIGFP